MMQEHRPPFNIPNLPSIQHGTCVAVNGRGLLIVGPSGSGKSALALQLIAFGAELVADDQCRLSGVQGALIASRPQSLPQAIEARGVGLLAIPCLDEAQVVAVLDASTPAQERMPKRINCVIGSYTVPLLQNPVSAHGPAALYLYLMHGFND